MAATFDDSERGRRFRMAALGLGIVALSAAGVLLAQSLMRPNMPAAPPSAPPTMVIEPSPSVSVSPSPSAPRSPSATTSVPEPSASALPSLSSLPEAPVPSGSHPSNEPFPPVQQFPPFIQPPPVAEHFPPVTELPSSSQSGSMPGAGTAQFFDKLQPEAYTGEAYEWGALANQLGPAHATPELLKMIRAARANGLHVVTWGDPASGHWGIACVTVQLPDGGFRTYYDTPHKLALLQQFAAPQ